MIKICQRCGCEFDGYHNRKFCDECRTATKTEAARRYRETHREQCNERSRRYNSEHPEVVREAVRRWRENHREQDRENSHKWRLNNPEKCRELLRRWKQANPERRREINRRYEAKRKHRQYIKLRAEQLRAKLAAKAAKKTPPPKREKHWTDYVSLTPSCIEALIYI